MADVQGAVVPAELTGAGHDDVVEDQPVETDVEPTTPEGDDDPHSPALDYLREQGLDTSKWKSGRDALSSLVQAQRLVGERDEHAKLGRWLAEHPDKVYAELQRRIGQAASTQPSRGQPPPDSSPVPAEPDPTWFSQFWIDQQGQAHAHPGGEKALQQFLAWQNEQNATLARRARDPLADEQVRQKLNGEFVSKKDFEKFAQDFGGVIQQHYNQQVAQQWIPRIATWAFNDGANWNSGYTHYGEQFRQEILRAAEDGIQDPDRQNRRAYEVVQRQMQLDGVTAKNGNKPKNPTGAQRRPQGKTNDGSKPYKPGEEEFEELMDRKINDAAARGEVSREEMAQFKAGTWF